MEQDRSDGKIDELLAQIEQGDIPIEIIIAKLLEILVKLNEKERRFEQLLDRISCLTDLNRKINEIHTLHFPAKELKKKDQRERFLA